MSLEILKIAVQQWQKKRAEYEVELAIVAGREQKYELNQKIAECKQKIEELNKEIESTIIHDITALKREANKAEHERNLELAEKLWTQVLLLRPTDTEAWVSLKNIWSADSKEQPESEIKSLQQELYQNQIQSYGSQIQQLKEQLNQKQVQIFEQSKVIQSLKQNLAEKELIISQLQEQLTPKSAGVDYSKLRDFLAQQRWQEADQETGRVMCLAAGREKEGWLGEEDIDNFPCEDLRTINQLWLHYSNGKFGFSVQKKIYQSLSGTREYNQKVWEKFCARVGWRVRGDWLSFGDLTYNLNAPGGHLPVVPFGVAANWWHCWSVRNVVGRFRYILLSRKDL